MEEEIEHIFVYGTLRPGHGANRFMDEAEHVGTFKYEGAEMFNLGSFPGILLLDPEFEVFGKRPSIIGDVYKFDVGDNILDRLDGYEGFNRHDPDTSLYLRKEINVEGIRCWVYEYNGQPRASSRVESGDWKDPTRLYCR